MMKRSYLKIIPAAVFGVLSLLFIFPQSRALACGPFFSNYIYTPEDISLIRSPRCYNPNFSAADPGIIFPSWRIQLLLPIYRALNGEKPVEAQADPSGGAAEKKSALEQWIEARKMITDQPVEIEVWATGNYYDNFINYLDDAFLTAAAALKERKNSFSNEEINLWLKGQDEVFGATSETLFDEQLDAKITNPLLKYDREYQRAAARFYQKHYEEAAERFKRIAANSDHPWRAYAALAVGRTFIRKANAEFHAALNKDENDLTTAVAIRNEWLKKASAQFEYILKDKTLAPVHASAQRLLDYTTFRLNPHKRFLDAEKVISTSLNPAEIERNLWDFYLIYNSWDETTKKDFILQNGGDFSQWVLLWKNGKPELADFAAERYRKTKSLPWLIACLRLMPPNLPGREEILRDAAKIPETSPAYLTVRYYYFLFLLKSETDRKKIARELDLFLKTIENKENPAAWDCFVNLRMLASSSLEEALRYSVRKATGLVMDEGIWEVCSTDIVLLDKKIKRVFNESLPLEEWVVFALRDDLFPPYISRHLRLTAFVRAVLMDRLDTAEKIARKLSSTDPALKKDLSAFLEAGSPKEKKFTAVFFILRYPRLNAFLDVTSDEIIAENLPMNKLDNYRRNWWNWKNQGDYSYPTYYYNLYDYDYDIYDNGEPDFEGRVCDEEHRRKIYDTAYLNKLLPARTIEEAASENQKMRGITAPNSLADAVIKYAAENPKDPRVPEALHLAVRATRYAGFSDEKTSGYSKKAFLLLHRRYPHNPWTKKTPYWY